MKSTPPPPHSSRRSLVLGTSILLLALFAASPRASSAPAASARGTKAHYVVFSLGEDGTPVPVSHQLVELPAGFADRAPLDLEGWLAEAPRGNDDVRVRLLSAEGETLWEDAVRVDEGVRLEEGLHGGPAADAHDAEPAGRAFVVRVPVSSGSRLVLTPVERDGASVTSGMGALAARRAVAPAEFDLADLEGNPRLSLARFATTAMPGATASRSANRLNLLVMGDGYTATERAKFEADAAALAERFLSTSPFSEYRSFIEVTTLFTPSAQSGATHPSYQAGCVGKPLASCCADPAAKSDPLQGTFVTTSFDATFCSMNIHRLLVVNTAKVMTAAAAAPGWDRILVLVNDSTYGGSGGSIAVASANASAAAIAQHEFGHSFAGLADEYDAAYPGYASCSDVSGSRACEPNVTDQTDPGRVKWATWIRPGTPIPTMSGSGAEVGLYEGARYQRSGVYRPQHDCQMRSLGAGLCRICAQQYVLKLHRGGWGNPSRGIDVIEPGTESPAARSVTVASRSAVPFSVELLQPAGGTVRAAWTVNGQPAGTGPSFRFEAKAAGTYTVRVVARDESPFVRPEAAGRDLESERTWTVVVKKENGQRTLVSQDFGTLTIP